ncbi:hypothetical protein BDV98DRAFT_512832, partial [Pterulicium gracile]
GAILSRMTQARAYKAILHQKHTKKENEGRRGINTYVKAIQDGIKASAGRTRNPRKSLTRQDIRRHIREFVWKIIHNIYWIGKKWENIPGEEHRANCRKCNEPEDMEHISLRCPRTNRQKVWDLAKAVYEKAGHEWPTLNMGTILASPLTKIMHLRTTSGGAAKRLYIILCPESAHLIWRLRNEETIDQIYTDAERV